MGFLTPELTAALKAIRRRAWNEPITVLEYVQLGPDDFYDPETAGPHRTVLSGDYAWRDDRALRGTAGGMVAKTTALIETDLAHRAWLMGTAQTGIRLEVDGVELQITTIASFAENESIVITAERVRA